VQLARQKPRYGYRRLHALLGRRGRGASAQRVYRIYRREGLAVRRLKRKRIARPAASTPLLTRSNQEWALDFACNALATGRAIRVLAVVDAFTRECLALETNTSLSSQRVTRTLERVIEQRGAPAALRCDKRTGTDIATLSELVRETAHSTHSHTTRKAHAERACGEL
jgi:putative transposase